MPIIRTENALVLWAPEAVWGQFTPGPWFRFGIHEIVNAPDPQIDWYPFYGISGGRGRSDIFPGAWNLRGSIPDIRLQRGINQNSGITVPIAAAVLALGLGRLINPSPIGANFTRVGAKEDIFPPFFDATLDSFAMQIIARDTIGNAPFVRQYYGGKVNRWTLSANEGDALKFSIDEMIFKSLVTNVTPEQNPLFYQTAQSLAGLAPAPDPGPDRGGQYFFAGAELFYGSAFLGRVKSFSLVCDNMLTPKRYLNLAGTIGPNGVQAASDEQFTQTINDLPEGKRSLTLTLQLDIVDPTSDLLMWNQLLAQGRDPTLGQVQGYQFAASFVNGDGIVPPGSISIVTPPSSGSAPPGVVTTAGAVNLPAPPAGYWDGRFTLDLPSIFFEISNS